MRLEIEHERVTADERVLALRGLDDRGAEIATATLRTGMVLYSPEPELLAPAWSAGTELAAEVGPDRFTIITPDREPHETQLPPGPLVAWFHLHAVAAAMFDEAAITFPASAPTTEVAFAAGACTGSRFPTAVTNPLQCCEDGNTDWIKIGNGGQLGWRIYSFACTTSGGKGTCGDPGSIEGACDYGPCGAANQMVPGVNDLNAAVFVPRSNPQVCGRDSNGASANGGIEAPEPYTGVQTSYAGVTASCPNRHCCYQPYAGYAVPESGTACQLINGETCHSNAECLSGNCVMVGDTGTCQIKQ